MPQISFEILALSESLIVIDKPAGFLSTPARFQDDPRPCVGTLLQTELKKQIYPVHRLDFEVSGPLIFALTPEAHRIANHWFEVGQIRKFYHTLSEGPPSQINALQIWKSKLVKGKRRTFEADYGKDSETQARCLGEKNSSGSKFSHWELSPMTGRSHQLRFEMQKHVGPIWGDILYGSKTPHPPNKFALACVALDLQSVENCLGLPVRIEKSPYFLSE